MLQCKYLLCYIFLAFLWSLTSAGVLGKLYVQSTRVRNVIQTFFYHILRYTNSLMATLNSRAWKSNDNDFRMTTLQDGSSNRQGHSVDSKSGKMVVRVDHIHHTQSDSDSATVSCIFAFSIYTWLIKRLENRIRV